MDVVHCLLHEIQIVFLNSLSGGTRNSIVVLKKSSFLLCCSQSVDHSSDVAFEILRILLEELLSNQSSDVLEETSRVSGVSLLRYSAGEVSSPESVWSIAVREEIIGFNREGQFLLIDGFQVP